MAYFYHQLPCGGPHEQRAAINSSPLQCNKYWLPGQRLDMHTYSDSHQKKWLLLKFLHHDESLKFQAPSHHALTAFVYSAGQWKATTGFCLTRLRVAFLISPWKSQTSKARIGNHKEATNTWTPTTYSELELPRGTRWLNMEGISSTAWRLNLYCRGVWISPCSEGCRPKPNTKTNVDRALQSGCSRTLKNGWKQQKRAWENMQILNQHDRMLLEKTSSETAFKDTVGSQDSSHSGFM